MKPELIVTVDTEEDGLWSGTYPRIGQTVRNIRGIEHFQHICDRFEIHPTYLIDAPVAQDDCAVGILRDIQESGRGEIGTHVHPWCNPPFEEESTPRNSYLCNLPASLQEQKIAWLTTAIEERFGLRPTSFRAGRYGLDSIGASILQQQGYLVDSSVLPFYDYSAEGGPDFTRFPHDPYLVGPAGLDAPDPSGTLLEVPVTVGYTAGNFRRAHALREFAARPPLRHMRAVGLLDRLGLVQRIKFCPEKVGFAPMKHLFDLRRAQRAECVVLMFHSSSLLPGASPYVPNDKTLEVFFSSLVQLFDYVICEHQCSSCTLTEFARRRRNAPQSKEGVQLAAVPTNH